MVQSIPHGSRVLVPANLNRLLFICQGNQRPLKECGCCAIISMRRRGADGRGNGCEKIEIQDSKSPG